MRHKIFVQRLGISEANSTYKEITQAVEKYIMKSIPNDISKLSIRKINEITETMYYALNKNLFDKAKNSMQKFAAYETKFNVNLFNSIKKFNNSIKTPATKTVVDAFLTKTIALQAQGRRVKMSKMYDILSASVSTDINKALRRQIAAIEVGDLDMKAMYKATTTAVDRAVKSIVYSRTKAVGITVTNHVSSTSLSSIYTYNSDVIKMVRWDTMLDSTVCPDCEELEGQEWELDDTSFDDPPLHINCRCVLAPTEIYDQNSAKTTAVKQTGEA